MLPKAVCHPVEIVSIPAVAANLAPALTAFILRPDLMEESMEVPARVAEEEAVEAEEVAMTSTTTSLSASSIQLQDEILSQDGEPRAPTLPEKFVHYTLCRRSIWWSWIQFSMFLQMLAIQY